MHRVPLVLYWPGEFLLRRLSMTTQCGDYNDFELEMVGVLAAD